MTTSRLYGVLAQFESASKIYKACEKVRDANYTRWDSFTPFPVHGLEKAMGLSRSKLPFVVFFFGITGASGAMTLQWWISAVDYPLIIAAKPFFSWQAFIPVTFEVMVLFSAASAVITLLAMSALPRWHHPLLKTERFAQATDNGFFIAIEADDPQFDADQTAEFLRSLGATHVELVED